MLLSPIPKRSSEMKVVMVGWNLQCKDTKIQGIDGGWKLIHLMIIPNEKHTGKQNTSGTLVSIIFTNVTSS